MAKKKQQYDFYLAGSIAHDSEAMIWRNNIESCLSYFTFYNPLKEERKITGVDLPARFKEIKQFADQGHIQKLDELKSDMWEIVIPNDISGITQSNALIVNIKRDNRICGTFIEMYEAFVIQSKPVYVISELKYSEMTNWEIALSSIIFHSFDELINYFRKPENIAKVERNG